MEIQHELVCDIQENVFVMLYTIEYALQYLVHSESSTLCDGCNNTVLYTQTLKGKKAEKTKVLYLV